MKKRVISLILAVIMVVTLLPMSAFAMKYTAAITDQPKSITVRPGESATFTVAAKGSGSNLYYLWFDADVIPASWLESLALDSVSDTNLFGFEKGTISVTSLVAKHGLEILDYYNKHPGLDKAVFGGEFEPNKESSTITINNCQKTMHIQCLVVLNNKNDLIQYADADFTMDTFLGMTDMKLTGYVLSDVVTLTVDPNAPCQNHTMTDIAAKEPTCNETGWDAHQECTVCGYSTASIIPVLPHTFGEWVIDKDSSCTEFGAKHRSCTVCGTEETELIAPVEHEFGEWMQTKAPTCTERGQETRYCINCDVTETRSLDAAGHKYKDGVCTVCKTSDPSFKPAAPEITGSNAATTGYCTLKWSAVPGAVKYEVYRATSKSGSYTKMSTTAKTTYTNTTSKAGTTYYYKVKAVSADGVKSSYSNIVTRTCDCAQPVVTLSNVSTSGKIKISWEKITGATKYEVYRATSKSGTYTKISTTTKTSITNTSAKAGKKYYYKVKAIGSKSAANSVYSAIEYRTCDLAKPVVKITTSKGDPKLSWAKIDGATKYEVYRATSKTGTYSKLTTTTKLTYTNTSAKAGKTYYYKVKAVCGTSAAASAYSSIVSIKAK